ncbi:CBS domain-containing protein [Candidatus Saccharibacteria bacterium]|nr:CBS domain-containing protein [Candidatus Saccharibacteria bacterium]
MKTIGILLLAVVLAKCILLFKVSKTIPLAELRRRARSGNRHTQALYKLLAFQTSLKIIILVLGTTSAAVLLLLAASISGWLVAVFILVTSWLLLDDKFTIRPGSWLWQASGAIASIILPVVDFLQPALVRVAKLFDQPKIHSRIYEKEDLLELLERQTSQLDNRITASELKIAKGALGFADKKVGRVMTPAKEVRWLAADESIGPTLMDELHKTGHVHFPVVKDAAKLQDLEVVGALYIKDLLKNLEKSGTVRDIMIGGVHFIGESHTLHQALDAFLKSQQHLLVVVNNFEEVVGVLTLENVLEQILGQKITDDFDNYHDLKAVAGHDSQSRSEYIKAK